jgi:hypothetical protein
LATEKVLYRIKPTDKKSIEAFYDVYKILEDGTVKGWNVTETYRWGQGFVESEEDLPYVTDHSVSVDPTVGWGCELDDLCAVNFDFDDSITEEEAEEISQLWEEGGAGWLYDGEHDWRIEEDRITIYGPFQVDKIDDSVYNEVIEENIELKPRPPLDPNKAWPF